MSKIGCSFCEDVTFTQEKFTPNSNVHEVLICETFGQMLISPDNSINFPCAHMIHWSVLNTINAAVVIREVLHKISLRGYIVECEC